MAPEVVPYKTVEKFREDHKHCSLETKLTNDDKDTVVIRCPYHSQLIITYIPYRTFCWDIKNCAGRHSCGKSRACSE